MSMKEAKTKNLPPKIETKSIASKGKRALKQHYDKETQNSRENSKRTDFILPGSDEPLDCHQELEKKKQQILIGQLRADESHNKIQDMRFRYRTMRAKEINLLISSQPTARKAIRLEALLPPYKKQINLKDTLNKLERKRVEAIMSDDSGLTTNRIP